MKIKYKEITVIDRIDEAVRTARTVGKHIEQIELTELELTEFCEIRGVAFSKNSAYRYNDFKVMCYERSSDK
jgi:hypothetical protein